MRNHISPRWGVVSFLAVAAFLAQTCLAASDEPGVPKIVQAKSDREDQRAGLGDKITVRVENLSNLINMVQKENKRIVLFLDGLQLKGLYPEVIDTVKRELRFLLRRTEKSKEAWNSLLGKPQSFDRSVSVSVGVEDGYAVATQVNDFPLIIIRGFRFVVFIILFLIILYVLVRLATESAILRDSGPKPAEGERAFSLARTQMAIWSFLVVISYLFLWIIAWDVDTITDSVLVLLGISSATALGSKVIDSNKEKPGTPPFVSTGSFLTDILSDASGISLHRFQMFVWTIVLGIIFVSSVYSNLAMPDFGTSLLALMGISSGTYVGFKLRE